MKKIIATAILLAAAGAVAMAAPPAGEGRQGRKGQRAQSTVKFLGLTEQQQEQWQALQQKHRADMKSLREEGRALRQQVRQALEADEPDAAVGEAVKAVHAHRQAMTAARETFESELVSVLNQEQKVKFEALKAARQMRGTARRGRGHRGGPAAGAPEGTASPPSVQG